MRLGVKIARPDMTEEHFEPISSLLRRSVLHINPRGDAMFHRSPVDSCVEPGKASVNWDATAQLLPAGYIKAFYLDKIEGMFLDHECCDDIVGVRPTL